MVSDGTKEKVAVPYLIGKNIDVAKEAIQEAGLKIKDVGYDFSSSYEVNEVIWQEIDANEEVEQGTAIKIIVSKGPETSKTVDLYISYSAAKNDVFFMTVTVSDEAGTRNIIANQQRNKSDQGENITLDGKGKGNVVVIFDGKQVMKKNIDFTKGTIS